MCPRARVSGARILRFFSVFALVTLSASPALSDDVTLNIRIAGGSDRSVSATVHAEPVVAAEGRDSTVGPLSQNLDVPGQARLSLGGAAAWSVRVEAEDLWSPRLLVRAGQGETTLTVRPLADLRGNLVMPDGGELPSELSLRFAGVPGGDEIEGNGTCPVDEVGVWRCRAPVGTLDLRLRAEGFVSHYFWDVTLETAEDNVLGRLSLERGASLAARVETEDGTPIAPDATATLAPRLVPGPGEQLAERSRRTGLSVAVHERGFVHFEGVAPGSYRLTLNADGFAALVIDGVEVREAVETELDSPLVLRRPLTMTVTVEPEIDLFGNRWHLRLSTRTGEEVASSATDLHGRWQQDGLPPGAYDIAISDSRGSRMAREEIDLEPGSDEFTIRLPVVWVQGEVRLGDEPLPSELRFGGEGAVSVGIATAEDGTYGGWLPRDGEWNVDVRSDEPRVYRRLRNVTVEVDPVVGVAQVDIVLPATILEGTVADESGRPVARAAVLAMKLPATEQLSTTHTDDDGEFVFHGFAPGEYRLEAQVMGKERRLSSDVSVVELDETSSTATVRLVVREHVSLRGIVLSDSGGVPGVNVLAEPLVSEGPTGMIAPRIVTDHAGRFQLDMPQGVSQVEITLLPPGYLLTRLVVDVDASKELSIPVRQGGGGTLRLAMDQASRDPYSGRSRPYLLQDGQWGWDLGMLSQWAFINGVNPRGSELIVPSMPPGHYAFCELRKTDEEEPRPFCEEGHLPPLGELHLSVPAASE